MASAQHALNTTGDAIGRYAGLEEGCFGLNARSTPRVVLRDGVSGERSITHDTRSTPAWLDQRDQHAEWTHLVPECFTESFDSELAHGVPASKRLGGKACTGADVDNAPTTSPTKVRKHL